MRHRTSFSALHSTVLFCRERHPHPKLYLEMQENAGEEEEKKKKKEQSGYTTSSESHLMLLSWVSPTLVILLSPPAQAGRL